MAQPYAYKYGMSMFVISFVIIYFVLKRRKDCKQIERMNIIPLFFHIFIIPFFHICIIHFALIFMVFF